MLLLHLQLRRVRGRPLTIGGGGMEMNLFFPRERLCKFFFPAEGLFTFFYVFFFLEKGLENFFFLDFLRASPQIINGRPLSLPFYIVGIL